MPVVNPIDLINTLDDAKNALRNWNNSGVVLTKDQLQQIIGKMNGKVAGSEVTLLYSGSLGSAQSWQVAESIGANSGL